MKPYLFVYGTLQRGHPETHRLLGDARFLGRGSISGTLYDLGRYPAVHKTTRDRGRVKGELFELLGADAERTLTGLDRYEGREYRRSRVLVRLDDGARHRAWVYVLASTPPQGARPVPTGVYRARITQWGS